MRQPLTRLPDEGSSAGQSTPQTYENKLGRPDPQEALLVLNQRKWSILLVAVIVVGIALFFSFQRTPIYAADASVLVTPLELPGATAPVEPNMATEVEVASSIAVAEIVVADLGLNDSPREVLEGLGTETPTDTEILELSYSHTNPEEAQRRTQGFAAGYLEYRRQTVAQAVASTDEAASQELDVLNRRLDAIHAELDRLVGDTGRSTLESEAAILQSLILQRQLDRVNAESDVPVGTIVVPAGLPGTPVSPNHTVNATFGLIAGLALGVGLAFLRDRLSGRLRTEDEVESNFQAPVLGRIPSVTAWRKRKRAYLVTRAEWRSPASESYRMLRTNLLSAAATYDAKTILVTSAHIGEGKSATSANLGIALARAGKRVVLISADLRRPRLDQFFTVHSPKGLTDHIRNRAELEDILVRPGLPPTTAGLETLRLILSGTTAEDTAELLASDRMVALLEELKKTNDIILIDAPPVLPVTDAVVLSRLVDGVLFVVGPRSATRVALVSARQQLEKVGAPIVGVVLNGTDFGLNQAYYTY